MSTASDVGPGWRPSGRRSIDRTKAGPPMSPTVARGGPSCQASCVIASTKCLQFAFGGQLNISSRLTMTDEHRCDTNSDRSVI